MRTIILTRCNGVCFHCWIFVSLMFVKTLSFYFCSYRVVRVTETTGMEGSASGNLMPIC